ncbi:diacylglycerol kinase (ATP) [Desulfonatronum thiosulfatophilum]|uniref:Diacylglycerol kinase n=1 Tax=Desulfonatronum thiosulfatophilum TaxID=617002 RepID=A0A1G6AG88_9BACT|nr:diacylglycerol kinase [Desulfonatronum thiosulfatophilum]SDB07461.1 diacylglycerol kinase (ATP) [Desulfonatronum thiosulfatophilum]
MEKRGLRGIPRLVRAAVCSVQGLRFAWKNQEAFRLEVLAALILIPLAFWWSEHAVERILLIGSVVLVMVVELLNSAVETVVDRIGLEHHALSGMAKDISSAAVLLTLLLVPFVWGMILLG